MPVTFPVPKDLVWLNTAFLGDLVLMTAATSLVKRKFPQVRQHLVTTPIGAQALHGEGFASICVFDKRRHSLVKSIWLAKEHFRVQQLSADTLTMQVHRSFRSSILSRALGFPVVTYNETVGAFLAHEKVDRVAALHEAARVGLLLQPLGVGREEIIAARPQLTVQNGILDNPTKVVGIAPGSVWGTKRWPLNYFEQLINLLLGSYDQIEVCLIGSQAELDYARRLIDTFANHPRVNSLIGKTALAELPSLYQRLTLVVSNDSSPIHYASALNIPTVGLFGPTVPEMGFGPLADKSLVCEVKKVPCRPCSDHGPMQCPLGHFACMNELKPEQVFAACQQILAN